MAVVCWSSCKVVLARASICETILMLHICSAKLQAAHASSNLEACAQSSFKVLAALCKQHEQFPLVLQEPCPRTGMSLQTSFSSS